MKKIIAIALATMMLLGCAVFASAAETTLPDLDCPSWWSGHTEGIEVTEEGFTATFTATTYADATGIWDGPLAVVYGADEAKVNGAGYTEYWVQRVDQYGFCVAAGYYGVDLNRWSAADALAEAGISVSSVDSRTDGWANFLTDLQAGVECTVTGKLEDGKVVMTFDCNGIFSTTTLAVDSEKTPYISLFGDMATLTNIVVTTPDAEEQPPVETPTEGYIAKLGFANSDWSVQEWGDNVNTTVTGEGTYTLTFNGSASNALVFVVDIEGAAADFAEAGFDVTALTITADGVEVPVDVTKLNTGDLEGNGKFRIEIYNEYGETKHNPPVDPNAVSFASELVITFTIAVPGAEEVPPTGDAIFAVLSVMVASGLGLTAVVSKKK